MWMALLGPLPKPAWFGNAAKLGYIIAVRLTAAVLANVFVFGGGHALRRLRAGEARWDISPAADQAAAGAMMMVEGSLVTLGLFCWLFLRAARQTEERQELVEYAATHGVELTTERAGSCRRGRPRRRAARAAGRRRRLTGERRSPLDSSRAGAGPTTHARGRRRDRASRPTMNGHCPDPAGPRLPGR